MDTALKAMKRAASAVLKEELKVLRYQVRMLKAREAASEELVRDLQARLDERIRAATSYSNELGRMRSRAQKAVDWANKHASPQGNVVALALSQWVRDGDAANSGCGFGQLHPFDRWGITPKP